VKKLSDELFDNGVLDESREKDQRLYFIKMSFLCNSELEIILLTHCSFKQKLMPL